MFLYNGSLRLGWALITRLNIEGEIGQFLMPYKGDVRLLAGWFSLHNLLPEISPGPCVAKGFVTEDARGGLQKITALASRSLPLICLLRKPTAIWKMSWTFGLILIHIFSQRVVLMRKIQSSSNLQYFNMEGRNPLPLSVPWPIRLGLKSYTLKSYQALAKIWG